MDDSGRAVKKGFVRRYDATVESIINTVYWVIVALILAFMFRTFIMEAFQIPTGSMAETLRGSHYHLRCSACGYKYDLGSDGLALGVPKCSSCGFVPDGSIRERASNGDRILVLKCIYEFVEPCRWDVVVFKYPVFPCDNYIKRMIALPGESVELIDGDVYINGEIARKPVKVQEELWTCVFDNDYARMEIEGAVKWVYPFANADDSAWEMNVDGGRKFSLKSSDGREHRLVYRGESSKDFEAKYVYNSPNIGSAPVCSDLKVRSYMRAGYGEGTVGIGLRKYGRLYRGRVDFSGAMVIERVYEGETVELARKDVFVDVGGIRGEAFSFSNVDHELTLEFGGERLVYDLGVGWDDVGIADRNSVGKITYDEGGMVEFFGTGEVDLYHMAIFRDIYYLGDVLRPRYQEPFTVGEDEFFVCGDNSPASFDSRMWASEGKGNNNTVYRTGVVPRDYLMGKAFFLYWGDAFKPFENMLPLVPNFSEMKFIYGGGSFREQIR